MRRVTFTQYLVEQERKRKTVPAELRLLLEVIARACKAISHAVSKGELADVLGAAGTDNVQGEAQKKLDVISNEVLVEANSWGGSLAAMASEEMDEPYQIPNEYPKGRYLLLFDPLDGSSNLDTAVGVGTIFTILRNDPTIHGAVETVCQPGHQQVAAGYVLYGSSTVFVITTGHGVHMFELDAAVGSFMLVKRDLQMPPKKKIYSVNEANADGFPQGFQDYLKWAHTEGYSSRYIGSMVADIHRTLVNGGVFLYPPTTKHPDGKLRLLYEANPMSFLVEQAGGMSVNGSVRTMDIEPKALHERTPLVMGSADEVEHVLRHLRG
jgi:fructose-1,6-bisphosphatase I